MFVTKYILCRLWDVRNQNRCIKIYRGHIAQVNSVKFSPDGLWIASAGTEGSVIIWDIRKSKQIMEFSEHPPAAAITCIQFHPFEFLLAVGRVDGTISIYDLESQSRISQTETESQFYGHPIKCITFRLEGCAIRFYRINTFFVLVRMENVSSWAQQQVFL